METTNPDVSIEARDERDDVLREAIVAGLSAHSEQVGHALDVRDLAVTAQDEQGELVGGLIARSVFSWLYIELLWVHESHRGRSIGKRLMQRAEQVAVERGCRGVYLNTIGFQARAFYEKLGYSMFGELEDDPPIRTRYYMRRRIR
jgi:GNAT superfamily N-acetyltransferase